MKIVKKKREREVDIDKLFEDRERQVKRKTKKYKDMKKYGDWEWLMRQVPGFWR